MNLSVFKRTVLKGWREYSTCSVSTVTAQHFQLTFKKNVKNSSGSCKCITGVSGVTFTTFTFTFSWLFLLNDPRGLFMYALLHVFKLHVQTHTHSVTWFLSVLKRLKRFQQNKLSFAGLPEALHSAVWHCSTVMLTQGQNEQLASRAQEPLPYRNHTVSSLSEYVPRRIRAVIHFTDLMRQGRELCVKHAFLNLSGQFGIKDFTCSGVYGIVQIHFQSSRCLWCWNKSMCVKLGLVLLWEYLL